MIAAMRVRPWGTVVWAVAACGARPYPQQDEGDEVDARRPDASTPARDGAGAIDAGAPDGAPADPFVRPRAFVDQPDEVAGAQLHVLYVYPAGAGARADLDTSGALRREVAAFNRWLGHRLGARLRVDTYAGAVDITAVELPVSELEMAHGADLVPAGPRAIRARLEAYLDDTFADPTKLYLVWYDGLSLGNCGEAPRPGAFPVVYPGGVWQSTLLTAAASVGDTTLAVHATAELPLPTPPFAATLDGEPISVAAVGATSVTLAAPLATAHGASALLLPDQRPQDCRLNPMSVDGVAFGYASFVALHEVAHALGLSPDEALDAAPPPVAGGHLHSGNPAGVADLMYQGPEQGTCGTPVADAINSPCQLDPGHRNYVNVDHGGADLARSVFLDPLPADAVFPPGW